MPSPYRGCPAWFGGCRCWEITHQPVYCSLFVESFAAVHFLFPLSPVESCSYWYLSSAAKVWEVRHTLDRLSVQHRDTETNQSLLSVLNVCFWFVEGNWCACAQGEHANFTQKGYNRVVNLWPSCCEATLSCCPSPNSSDHITTVCCQWTFPNQNASPVRCFHLHENNYFNK